MSVHTKKNGTWYCQYRIPGVKNPIKEYFGVGPLGEEQARARDVEIKELKKRGEKINSHKIYLDELSQAYISDRKMHGASLSWLQELTNLLNTKLLPNLCFCAVNELSYRDILATFEKLYPNTSLATKQRYLAYLKAIFNFGIKHEITTNNPLTNWKRQKEPRHKVRLTFEDLQKIIKYSPPHLKWAIKVQWETMTRPGKSELFALKYSHIDYQHKTLRIPGTKTAGSDRAIPISKTFCQELKKRENQSLSGFLIEYLGKPVKTLKTALLTAQRRANLSYRVRLYDIRHLSATTMLANGADVAAVSRLLGHESISTTQEWYHHVLPGAMVQAISYLPSLDKEK